MLQRGLLTIAEKQQQQLQQPQPPYDTTKATTTRAASLLKEQEQFSSSSCTSSRQDLNLDSKERVNCLPIIEMPQIKIEQDADYMEGIEEEQELQQEEREEETQAMEVDEKDASKIKPVPQLLEPTSILKTSLLTGAANTLATLTAAAEQIARMPNESLAKNYPYFREENKRTYAIEEEHEKSELATKDKKIGSSSTTTTYTSILQTALMSKRPATLNVAASSLTPPASLTSSSLASTKSLHVRTPDQVLKTAVTLATLGEIAAQQEQQQQQLQQQQQQQLQHQQQQQPHILVVPQVQRKMCILPFKKLNFANVTKSSSTTLTSTNSTTSSAAAAVAAASAAAATTTTITNNYLGSNLKANTNLIKSSCILNTNNLAASTSNNNNNNNNNSNRDRDKLETNTATYFDTNNIINNVTICSNNNNSNNNNSNYKSQTMATQTLKIPTIKPHLVTTQTQTEETSTQTQTQTPTPTPTPATLNTIPLTLATTLTNSSSSSSLQTANSGLLRTAVSANTKMLTQNSSLHSLSNKLITKTKLQPEEENVASYSAATNVADNVVCGNIYKHVSGNSKTLTKMNVIQNKTVANPISPTSVTTNTDNGSSSTNTTTNVTVVVFETLLPED